MTENKKNIYQKLLDVMTDVRYIEKEKKTVNNQYRFVSHDAVTAATSEAFIKHGVYAKPRIVKNEITTIEVDRFNKYEKITTKETNFICSVEVEYDFINVENPEDRICGINGLGQGIDNQDKACGKAISYACKYALLKALGIETGDEPEKDVDYSVSSAPKNDKGFFKKPKGPLAGIAEQGSQEMQEKKAEKKAVDTEEKLKKEEEGLERLKTTLASFGSVAEIDGYLNEIPEKSKSTPLQAINRMSEINAGQAKVIIRDAKFAVDPEGNHNA